MLDFNILKVYTAYVDILSTFYFASYSRKTCSTSLFICDGLGIKVIGLGSRRRPLRIKRSMHSPPTWLAVLWTLGSTLSKTNMESENDNVQKGSSRNLFKGFFLGGVFHLCFLKYTPCVNIEPEFPQIGHLRCEVPNETLVPSSLTVGFDSSCTSR